MLFQTANQLRTVCMAYQLNGCLQSPFDILDDGYNPWSNQLGGEELMRVKGLVVFCGHMSEGIEIVPRGRWNRRWAFLKLGFFTKYFLVLANGLPFLWEGLRLYSQMTTQEDGMAMERNTMSQDGKQATGPSPASSTLHRVYPLRQSHHSTSRRQSSSPP